MTVSGALGRNIYIDDTERQLQNKNRTADPFTLKQLFECAAVMHEVMQR